MTLTSEQFAWWDAQREAAEAMEQPWQSYPWSVDRWSNFTPYELRSRGDGLLVVVPEFMDVVQSLRAWLNRPLIINSFYRSEQHNAAVGGAEYSMHQLGLAADCRISDPAEQDAFAREARARGCNGIKIYKTFVHIDMRPWHWLEDAR